MAYIFKHWNELNLIDRAWFIVGAWLMVFFLITFFVKILPSAFRSKQIRSLPSSSNEKNQGESEIKEAQLEKH